jgi:hypothetical protein
MELGSRRLRGGSGSCGCDREFVVAGRGGGAVDAALPRPWRHGGAMTSGTSLRVAFWRRGK